MWQSWVEIEHYSIVHSITLSHLKHHGAELPLRVGLIRTLQIFISVYKPNLQFKFCNTVLQTHQPN